MSKTFGVISWNVLGDKSDDTGQCRKDALQKTIADIQKDNLPVDFICLQETSGANGHLMPMGYVCHAAPENMVGGKQYVVAINPESGYGFSGCLEQVTFRYKSLSGGPLRYPVRAKLISSKGDQPILLYTVHASLYGGLAECLKKYSQEAEKSVKSKEFGAVFITGDLNITDHSKIHTDDGNETTFIEELFPSFMGVNHHLDHVYCWSISGIKKLDGRHYAGTTSDHDLVYANFTLS